MSTVFEPESIDLRDEFQGRLVRKLSDLAIARANGLGRENVTEGDFRACLRKAIDLVLNEMRVPENAECAAAAD